MKKLNKKGFTLAELLIVIAIMAILIGVAIPVFSAQLEKARETADAATARSATELAYGEYLLNHVNETDGVTYYFKMDTKGNLSLASHTATAKNTSCGTPQTGTTSSVTAQSKIAAGVSDGLTVEIDKDGNITNSWSDVLLK